MKQTVVIYPSPGIGHLISMVEFGKQIINHHPSFSITILITTVNPSTTAQTTPYINRISQSTPSIIFHHLPNPTQNQPNHHQIPSIFEILHKNNPIIHKSLQTLSLSSTISAFIFDVFCATSLQVTTQLQIPSYFFFTSGANALSVLLNFPTLHKTNTGKINSHNLPNTYLNLPGLPPILATDMPSPIFNRNDKSYESFLAISNSAIQAKGIIVNTFESLESRAIKAIRDGLCIPDSPTPPVYPIGPLIAEPTAGDHGDSSNVDCLTWLDEQPRGSVVFLCFGSGGVFSAAQLKEIGVGLERSGQRFLWVVRSAPTEDKSKRTLASVEPDLESLLPEGFLDRTRDRGLVVKNWAPQVDVLNRESVGGFVTHCGWNSILESVSAGVPMIGWPLYAEQRLNRVVLVKEMKLGLWLNESEDGFVTASEIEERVRALMESEEGRELKERVLVAKDEAKAALSEGGSSRSALAELVESWCL
ncbi:UDP-glucuronosyl/UDP-glucosyltransferase [Macleaya cordata]|uniref:Glycosyltransferase n=1 Tax=Macleaya cordata TaxID=56857 RepID=A0A200R2J1_MACCD|nr:UDP-glucuronosyl/UDP-glucosyltransferase [Macleaya cordata]